MTEPLECASGQWRRSSFHSPEVPGAVEVYLYGDGVIGVQNARHHGAQIPTGLAKLFSPEAWAAFTEGVKAGEFDLPPADGESVL